MKTTTVEFASKLESRRANPGVPGDTTRVLTRGAEDTSGQFWPVGTEFLPLEGGRDNVRNRFAVKIKVRA